MTENTKKIHYPLIIDLNQFKLRIDFKRKIELTLHFNSPSRRFYLSVIAFVVNEMKRLGRVTSVPLEGNYELLVLLNDTVGGSAGSSRKENLLPRIYRKWKDALPNLEEAPLFKVLGRTKKYDEGAAKAYAFSEAEKDNWANLFEYTGSEDKVRLKFALDKIEAGLDDVVIIFEDSQNGDAWDTFLLSLKEKVEKGPETKPIQQVLEELEPPVSLPKKQGTGLQRQYRWMALIAMVIMVAGASTWVIWELYFGSALVRKASIERMAFPLPDKPSIAVMPFVNMSDDPQQEYFSDGMTEDLITDLSKISGLFVIARNSTFIYKGKSVKIRQVAEELGVRYLLEGSVRREGDRVRINVQLIDALTGRHLWAERYDGSMEDVFSLQDKINQNIVAALTVNLTPGERAQVAHKGTNDPAAYEEFMKGRKHYLRFTKEDLANAEACFKRAIELDPKFARAQAALALLYFEVANNRMETSLTMNYELVRLRARLHLTEALKKPNSIALQVAGLMDLNLRQWDLAISQLEKALALDPNDPAGHDAMSWVLSMSGRPGEGIEHAKMAMRLDPLNPARYLGHIGIAQFCMAEWREAVNAIEKALNLNPELGPPEAVLASAYAHLGRNEEAKAASYAYYRKVPMWQMHFWPFRYRQVEEYFVEGLVKAGFSSGKLVSVHVSKEDQLAGDDLAALFFPAKFVGVVPSDWSQEVTKDGIATLRAPFVPKGLDTGTAWLEGDKLWFQYQNFWYGMAYCNTVFRNPKGAPERKDEYIRFNDLYYARFSRVR
jgi:TolB-like protein/Tfp pilus assembly protein PilF